MKKLTALAAATAIAASFAGTASAGEVIKPLTATKSTQVPVSLGLGGLGAGVGVTTLVIGGVIATVLVVQATSGT